MVSPDNVTSSDGVKLGAEFVGALFTLWWNLQYLRFMKFFLEPPYKFWTVAIFRIFNAICCACNGAAASSRAEAMNAVRRRIEVGPPATGDG